MTLNQLLRKPRKQIGKKSKNPILEGCPQIKAVCEKVTIAKPKKPNSANRAIAKVRFTKNNIKRTIFIPGEKHNIQKYSTILVQGGRRVDLPGVNLKCVRGVYDLHGVEKRKTSRSVYGAKRK